jgi:outer membrane lipoprotein-sorting protein
MRKGIGFFAVACLFSSAVALPAEDLERVLAAHYEARGGLERLREVESLSMTGVNRFQDQEISVRYLAKRPNLLRMESSSPHMGMIRAFDGERAWQALSQPGQPLRLVPISEQDALEVFRESDFDGPLVDYEDKGHEIEFLGTDTLNEREVYRLRLTEALGPTDTYYLDAETYLVVLKATNVAVEGGHIAFHMYYDDFREVDGVVYPFRTTVTSEGQTIFVGTINEMELNADLDRGIFQRPE